MKKYFPRRVSRAPKLGIRSAGLLRSSPFTALPKDGVQLNKVLRRPRSLLLCIVCVVIPYKKGPNERFLDRDPKILYFYGKLNISECCLF